MVGIGSVVSHYRLERRLGAGGMGEVYLAQDTSLNRPVAIKFLIAPGDEHGRQRLLREARAVAALDHPAICAVYEVGTDAEGGDFIVMQYIEGESLAARLRRGRLPADEALRLGGQMAEALRAAHHRGIVHRDLKPQNIIVTPSGAPKLLDFGLARHLETGEVAAEAETVSPLTQPHAMMGTPGYMAPEQLRGRPADARSDVFALGCVLYECLTGRRTFTGTTSADINGQALHVDPPPVSSVVPELGPAYDTLCSRLLQKAPEERFQSAEEVVGVIRALTGAPSTSEGGAAISGTSTVNNSSFFGRRGLVAAIVIALLGVGGMWATWQWRRGADLPQPPPEAVRFYERGVEALREGANAGAKASLQEALRIFPKYVQAYSRLAEAQSELDDDVSAQRSLLQVNALVPDLTRLRLEDRLRLDGARASALRDYDQAIDNYRTLAERHPRDPGGWLDLARVEEAAERRSAARADCEKALALDGQYAAAHLRLGALQSTAGQAAAAMASFEEAIRLYRAEFNPEGEAEALLRKSRAQSTVNQLSEARGTLEQAIRVATDPRFVSQRVRAKFALARLTLFAGQFTEAERMAHEAIDEAAGASLQSLAAYGLIELSIVLIQMKEYDKAELQLERSVDLANSHGAVRTEMRARLQQASLKLETHQPLEAIKRAELPMRFFSQGHYVRLDATAKNIVSRAQEALDNYGEASRLATEALQLEESIGDDALVATSLENLVGQLTNLGRLPEALKYRERIEGIYRTQKAPTLLSYDLPNRADLLIRLGRGEEARKVLDEIQGYTTAGVEAFRSQSRLLAQLRALLASTTLRFSEVEAFADEARGPAGAQPDTTRLWAKVLAEHARAQLGTSHAAPEDVAGWPGEGATAALQREISYWAACTLLARRQNAMAHSVATKALQGLVGHENPELAWRLAAVAAQAIPEPAGRESSASMRAQANTTIRDLITLWDRQADAYVSRPDLAALRQHIR